MIDNDGKSLNSDVVMPKTKFMLASPTGLGIRNDPMGSGYYHAPRGHGKHKGLDFICEPGQEVLSPITGSVVRIARPYADKEYSGLLIGNNHIQIKMFYFNPVVGPGDRIIANMPIGIAQDISEMYGKEMTPHIHLEIVSVNPVFFL